QESRYRRRISQVLAGGGARLQGQSRQGRRRDLRVLHLEGLRHVAGDLRQGAGQGRGRSGLPVRPRAGPAEGRRGAAAREEDFSHSRLEEGAAAGVVGEGEGLGGYFFFASNHGAHVALSGRVKTAPNTISRLRSHMQGKVGLEEHFAIADTVNDTLGMVPKQLWPELR